MTLCHRTATYSFIQITNTHTHRHTHQKVRTQRVERSQVWCIRKDVVATNLLTRSWWGAAAQFKCTADTAPKALLESRPPLCPQGDHIIHARTTPGLKQEEKNRCGPELSLISREWICVEGFCYDREKKEALSSAFTSLIVLKSSNTHDVTLLVALADIPFLKQALKGPDEFKNAYTERWARIVNHSFSAPSLFPAIVVI